MNATRPMKHEFVEFIPQVLAPDTIYVSIPFATTAHSCGCGCGLQVVAPLSPTDWTLTFDGETISLDPSIGNWNFPCRSHYWITRGTVRWAASWNKHQVDANRATDAAAKRRQFSVPSLDPTAAPARPVQSSPLPPPAGWRRLLPWIAKKAGRE